MLQTLKYAANIFLGKNHYRDDAVQEVYLKYLLDKPEVRRPLPWAITALINKSRDMAAAENRRKKWDAEFDFRALESVEISPFMIDLNDALLFLTPGRRESFRLVHIEGFTIREASKELKEPTTTVFRNCEEAKKELRRILKEYKT